MCRGVPPPKLSYFNDDIVIGKPFCGRGTLPALTGSSSCCEPQSSKPFAGVGVDVDDMIAWVSDAGTYKVSNTEVKYPDHKESDNDGEMITEHVRWFIWAYGGNAGCWGCSDLRSIRVNCGRCQCLLGLGKCHLLSFIRIIQLCLR